MRLISSSEAVSETLNTRDDSLNLRFSVGTNPSKKMLIPLKNTKNNQNVYTTFRFAESIFQFFTGETKSSPSPVERFIKDFPPFPPKANI